MRPRAEARTRPPGFPLPRPGHADLAGVLKYDHKDVRNVLERASARETAARVAIGALAKCLLAPFGIRVYGWVTEIGGIRADHGSMAPDVVAPLAEESQGRMADADAQAKIIALI